MSLCASEQGDLSLVSLGEAIQGHLSLVSMDGLTQGHLSLAVLIRALIPAVPGCPCRGKLIPGVPDLGVILHIPVPGVYLQCPWHSEILCPSSLRAWPCPTLLHVLWPLEPLPMAGTSSSFQLGSCWPSTHSQQNQREETKRIREFRSNSASTGGRAGMSHRRAATFSNLVIPTWLFPS